MRDADLEAVIRATGEYPEAVHEVYAECRRARASEKALREALVRELDACFCDDVDGNCALPPGPECDRCQRIRATLAKQP